MSIIRVTATVTFEYDTDDLEGICDTVEGAEQDVVDMINSGDLLAHQYEITVVEIDADSTDN